MHLPSLYCYDDVQHYMYIYENGAFMLSNDKRFVFDVKFNDDAEIYFGISLRSAAAVEIMWASYQTLVNEIYLYTNIIPHYTI